MAELLAPIGPWATERIMKSLLRIILLALLPGVAASSFASFDLVMGLDFTNRVIRRFDGTTGASLGSFGQGYLGAPGALTINQTLGRAYVYDRPSAQIVVFNYNTGEYIQNWATGGGAFSWLSTDNTGNILLGGSDAGGVSILRRYSPTGALLSTYNAPSATDIFGIAQTADGSVWAPSGFSGNKGIYRYNIGGGNFTSFTPIPTLFAPGGDVRAIGNRVYFVGANQASLSFFSSSNPASITTATFTNQFSTILGVTAGHGSIIYLAGLANGGSESKIVRYNLDTGVVSTVGAGVSGAQYLSVAAVVAPEPATMLSLLVGAIALSSRRKKSR